MNLLLRRVSRSNLQRELPDEGLFEKCAVVRRKMPLALLMSLLRECLRVACNIFSLEKFALNSMAEAFTDLPARKKTK
jgi:hypothetical protein